MPSLTASKVLSIVETVSEISWPRLDEKGWPVGVRKIDQLTCFVRPSLRRNQQEYRVDYELCLVVLQDPENWEKLLAGMIGSGEIVGKPRVYPSVLTLKTFTDSGEIQNELAQLMIEDLDRYTMSAEAAFQAISNESVDFFVRLKRAYPNQFEERILTPLSKLIDGRN